MIRPTPPSISNQRVLVIGAGMAGLCALETLRDQVQVTLAEPAMHFEWLPNIHELISGIRTLDSLRLPYQQLFQHRSWTWLHQRVAAINGATGEVRFDDGREQQFDAILLACGGINNTYGVPGSDDYALPFKSAAQCQRIGDTLQRLMQQGKAHVTIVGTGVEGIEALGEILRRYGHHPGLQIMLVDSAERLLQNAPASVDRWLRQHIANFHVELKLNTRVAEVCKDKVRLTNDQVIKTDMVIWTGGVAPPAWLADSGLAPRGEWLPVNPDLRACASERIWAAGDIAALPTLGKQAYHAMDMGRLAARNILASLRGRAGRDFQPSPKPLLVTFGDLDCFMITGQRAIAGVALSPLKEAIYQLNVARIESLRGTAFLGSSLKRAVASIDQQLLPDLLRREFRQRLPRVRLA